MTGGKVPAGVSTSLPWLFMSIGLVYGLALAKLMNCVPAVAESMSTVMSVSANAVLFIASTNKLRFVLEYKVVSLQTLTNSAKEA